MGWGWFKDTIPVRGIKMSAKNPKQIVYRYNGVESSEEVEDDLFGEIPIPLEMSFIIRKGKTWKVAVINWQVGARRQVPVLKLFLTDQF